MGRWKLRIVGLLALAAGVGFVSQSPTPQRVPAFSQMKAGESIDVDFRSNGCFNSEHLGFRFVQGKDLRVEIAKFVFDKTINDEVKKPMGSLSLSKSDAQGLDGLLRFYRNLPEGACTTSEHVQMTLLRRDVEVATETFLDQTCSPNQKDVVRLTNLRDRLIRE